MSKPVTAQSFVAAFFCLLCSSVFAQHSGDSLISSKISSLEAFWLRYNTIAPSSPQFGELSLVGDMMKTRRDSIQRKDLEAQLNEAKIRKLKADVGLAGTAGYVENFDPAVDEDNSVYRRRVQAGLDWNILSDGYFESRYKQKILKNEQLISSLTPQSEISEADYVSSSRNIIFVFNREKLRLLEQRQQILDDKLDIANELYLLKQISRSDILSLLQQQSDVTAMMRVYDAYNAQIQPSALPKAVPPLFDIDIAKLPLIAGNKVSDSVIALKAENIALRNKLVTDIRLSTQLRYNYYDLSSASAANRSYVSAGIGLSVPLPLGIHATKDLTAAEIKLMQFDEQQKANEGTRDLLGDFYEFRYKQKQYCNYYSKKLKYEELIRVERVREKLEDLNFNPLSALTLLDEYLSIQIEMFDLQQQMYLKWLDIRTNQPGIDEKQVIVPFDPSLSSSATTLNRSIYIWSEVQLAQDANYIEEYLKMNKIGNAIVSLRADRSNIEQAKQLLSAFQRSGITTELMAGSNKLISNSAPAGYYDSLLAGIPAGQFAALHLDVEPHALADWDSNKEKYLALYVELLKSTRKYCDEKKVKLSVSIPVFYPEAALAQIYALADNVYLMAYEHDDADYIVRKIAEELAAGTDKTVVALRAKDFKNRAAFESLLTQVALKAGITKVAMHDLQTFIELDQQSVSPGKK